MSWTFTAKPASRRPRRASTRWWPRTLVWGDFLCDLREADLIHYGFATPELGVKHLMSILTTLCRKHKKRKPADSRKACWWTSSLTVLRSRLRALQRLYRNSSEPQQRGKLGVLFRLRRAEYKKTLLHRKRLSFQMFLADGLATNRLGQVVEVVRGRWRREASVSLALPDGTRTSTWEDSQDELARFHFLQADDVLQSVPHRTNDFDLFQIEELELAAHSLPPRKVPGLDGFGLEIVRKVLEYHPVWLLALYNHCLRASCFPRIWKQALVVNFPKPGKDPSLPASYRPICLLPAFGKVLDKMCATRLSTHLETTGIFDQRQYGFRKRLSTIDALRNVQNYIAESREQGEFTCLLTLDIKNAFNSARRVDILRLLIDYDVDPCLVRLIVSFLWERTVVLTKGVHRYNVGVPQGSCLGPILWLVLMNDLLVRFTKTKAWVIQAFADDVFVAARSPAVYRFADILHPVLAEIHRWSMDCGLTFSYDKCSYTIVPPKGQRYRNAPSRPILMEGHKIAFRWTLKYLGLTMEANLSWMQHLTDVQEKAFNMLAKMNRLVGASWGLRPVYRKLIYSVVAERILLYGAAIWYSDTVRMANRLRSMQRALLLCVTRCYRTVATDALFVLSGVLPLDLRAERDRDFALLSRWNQAIAGTNLSPGTVELWNRYPTREDLFRIPWTSDLSPRSPCRYYTDGSKLLNGHVGCAFVAVGEEGQILVENQFRLSDGAEVFAAEVHAINAAITDAHQRGLSEIDVYSDSRSALMALHSLVIKHRAVAEIKDLVKRSEIKVHLHWIRAHMGLRV